MECENSKHSWNAFLHAIPQNIVYSWKSEKNRPRLIIIPFKIYLKNFPIQKLFPFFSFLSLSINVRKVYQRLLWCRSTGKSWTMRGINKNFARNLLLANRWSIFFQWQIFTKKAPRLVLVNIPVPAQRRTSFKSFFWYHVLL